MKPHLLIIMVCAAGAALTSCGSKQPPPQPPQPPVAAASDDAALPPADNAQMTEFFFYRAAPGGVEPRPSFVMRTPRVSITIEGMAVLEQVEAEIYGRDNLLTTIGAERGRFDQETKTATMEGNVVLERGTMRIDMQDLVWRDEERMAKTEKPVHITDEGTQLSADNLEFHADEDALLLDNLTGDVTLAGRSES